MAGFIKKIFIQLLIVCTIRSFAESLVSNSKGLSYKTCNCYQ